MTDTIVVRGTLDTFRGGSFATEEQAVVITRSIAQIDTGFPSWHSRANDPIHAPFDQEILFLGRIKIYDLNPITIFPTRGKFVLGNHGYATDIVSEHRGTFEDFAIWPYDTGSSYLAEDPVGAFVIADNQGTVTAVGTATSAWQRHYRVLYPPKNARYAVPHLTLGSFAATGYHYFDAFQLEVLPLSKAANATTFEAARMLKVKVRPAAKNYIPNGSVETNAVSWVIAGPSMTPSTLYAKYGSQSLQVTWGASFGTNQYVRINPADALIPGDTYWASAWVYVPVGQPRVKMQIINAKDPASAVTGANATYGRWERFILPFVATVDTPQLRIVPFDSPVGGEKVYVDGVMISDQPVDYFDGSFGADYLWKAGGTAHGSPSYYYPDRIKRHYILKRTLQENVALGVSVADPEYATT
jgi:hypothetical protein